MRIHIIACRVLTRELSYLASQSPHTVDITWLPQGLHDTPEKLRALIADAIDGLYRQREQRMLKHFPDVIVLGYGLCSNGVVGLESRDIPLVIPRTDDCIALFLGSQERYLRLFEEYNGTYWLNNGWIETAYIPSLEMKEEMREDYIRRYGEENAEFLLEQDNLWIGNYNTCGYIGSPISRNPGHPALARQVAAINGWKYAEFEGDIRLLRMMTEGTWTDEEFCICPPRHRVEAEYTGKKIQAVPLGADAV